MDDDNEDDWHKMANVFFAAVVELLLGEILFSEEDKTESLESIVG